MTALRRLLSLLSLLCVLLSGGAHAQDFVPVPALQARVTDLSGMLTDGQRATLENVLKDYEDRTGSQIAILMVPTTAPEAIEQFSIRVLDAWKLGRKGVDDGVLLVVAKDNPPALRRLRLEVGRGVQGTLTDAQSKRILQDVIAPHFRQNDFYGGLAAGISAITSLLDKEQLPEPQQRQADEGGIDFSFLLFLFFVFLFMTLGRRGSGRRARHRHGWGGVVPGVILGGSLGHGHRGGYGGGGFGGGGFGGGFGGGGFGGGGGTGDGGGASGGW